MSAKNSEEGSHGLLNKSEPGSLDDIVTTPAQQTWLGARYRSHKALIFPCEASNNDDDSAHSSRTMQVHSSMSLTRRGAGEPCLWLCLQPCLSFLVPCCQGEAAAAACPSSSWW